jgi:hypothetical protein
MTTVIAPTYIVQVNNSNKGITVRGAIHIGDSDKGGNGHNNNNVKSDGCKIPPLNYPRIGFNSILTTANITATSSQDKFDYREVVGDETYKRWKPASLPANFIIDAGEGGQECDYIGIGAHTLTGCRVVIAASDDNATWQEIIDFLPENNRAIFGLFGSVTYRYWRIRITGNKIPTIGNIKLGKCLVMPSTIYGGHSPITLSRKTAIINQVSDNGQFVDRSTIRNGIVGDYQFKHMPADWVRSELDPFLKHARTGTFYISWNPTKFPDEAAYVWTNGDIAAPQNMGIKDYMSFSFQVAGYSDE